MEGNTNTEGLMGKAFAGDEDALDRFAARVYDRLRTIIKRARMQIKNAARFSDTEEDLWKAWEKVIKRRIESGKPYENFDHLRNTLFIAAKRLLLDQLKSFNAKMVTNCGGTGQVLSEQAGDTEPVDSMALKEQIQLLESHYDQLDELERPLMDRIYFEGMSIRAAAKDLEIPPQTALDRHNRILMKLGSLMGD